MSSPVAGPVPPAAPGDDPAVVRSDDDPAVVLSGFGPVGRAFAERLLTHADELARDHGVRPRLAAVRVGSAEVELRDGGPVPPRAEWAPPGPLARTLDRTGARVLVQALPSSPQLRQQAADEAVLALGRGVHVVTATNSHLLGHWREHGAAARPPGSPAHVPGAGSAADQGAQPG
ncbi:homoserine dehydrogenase, partial [Kitasatospora sp. NPDC059146]